MPRRRTLWIGPCGAPLRDEALASARPDPSSLWIVPSPLAREQVIRRLAERHRCLIGLRVWCWDDLWAAVREASPTGPARLSDAAARAALRAAIDEARADGELSTISDVVGLPGFRNRLRNRLAGWTRAERSTEGNPPADDPITLDEWAIFVRYRAILHRLDAEDAGGFAAWASKALRDRPPRGWKKLGQTTFLDPVGVSPAVLRVLEFFEKRADAVRVTLPFVDDPAQAEVFASVRPLRDRLLSWGFQEIAIANPIWRPPVLREVESELFREDSNRPERVGNTAGLKVLGAPQGEGCGLVIARDVKQRLEQGAEPDDILILVRRWGDEAELIEETLRLWGYPVSAIVGRRLAAEPAISALRLAISLPSDDWPTDRLVRLLRNGRFRPTWDSDQDPWATARAAAAIRSTRVFRGLDPLRRSLQHVVSEPKTKRPKLERARLALGLLDTLNDLIGSLDRPAPWRAQVGKLRRLVAQAKLAEVGDDALDHLTEALEDHGEILEGLGLGDRPLSWAAFVNELDTLIADTVLPPTAPAPGTIRIAEVDAAEGARAAHLILANLAEGTFPVREAVEANLSRAGATGEGQDEETNLAYAREMLRFLRVVGSAERELILVHPTSDAKGQELLMAGFLDDVLRLFDERTREKLEEEHRRFHPALLDRPELAGAPRDLRVRAVGLACVHHDPGALARLATSPQHRPVLDGTADALIVTHARLAGRQFGRHDGQLSDPRAAGRLRGMFGPGEPLSPSQLESYLTCPFQFFLRYVMRLEPLDDRDELEEDYAERGSRIHRMLEELERKRLLEPRARAELAVEAIENELRTETGSDSLLASGLWQIELRRLERTVLRYARQHDTYDQTNSEVPAQPHAFEVGFGPDVDHPCLTIGQGETAVTLQGKIDRIDVLATPDGPRFRVIDYKSGARPSKTDVRAALWVQLPLYALAVERLGLSSATALLHDFGYWCLRDAGYKPIRPSDWETDREALEAYVVAQVDLLRQGVFPVHPRKNDCEARCEYNSVCRIRQARSAQKSREQPALEIRT